jgi:STE24 endopeptidase
VERYFSAAEIERGRRYARPQLALGLTGAAVELSALIAVARRAVAFSERGSWRGPAAGAAAGAALSVGLSLPPLPLSMIARRRSLAVGLATQTWRDWGIDLLKANAIQSVLAGGAGASIVALTRRWPRWWWLPAGAGSVFVGAGLAALAPVVLDPIFNDFTPLPEGQARSDVLELAQAAGVNVREVYSVDASRRTTAANAYVTGLGPTKRVVLFDTLLDRYDRDELRLVVAHELAHVKHRDVLRSVAFAGLVAVPSAFAVQELSRSLGAQPGSAASLPVLALAAAAVTLPVGIIANRLSRAVERRADTFALKLAGAPEAFVSFERRIALQNVADLDPPRWFVSLLSTHPPTMERIALAAAQAEHLETAPTGP